THGNGRPSKEEFISEDCQEIKLTKHNRFGRLEYIKYYDSNRRLHRTDGPAIIIYNTSLKGRASIIEEHYYRHGSKHRADGPCLIYYKDGQISKKEYRQYGTLHRENEPAIVWYDYLNNVILPCYEVYRKRGRLHRLGGPAIIKRSERYYAPTISVSCGEYIKIWAVDGKIHRTDGPAIIEYFDSSISKIKTQEYWINGKKVE